MEILARWRRSSRNGGVGIQMRKGEYKTCWRGGGRTLALGVGNVGGGAVERWR